MAGHSKFANIKHRKGAQDAKRAKEFTKLTREIMVAASEGQPDPVFNPRLRAALATARKAGVPKDRIESAVKKGSGEMSGEKYESMRYEGYGPGGVAILVDALSDNRNRAASEVRTCFNKSGGTLAETGSVGFMFDQVGLIEYPASIGSEEELFEAVIEAGADNVVSDEESHSITCAPDSFSTVRDALEKQYGEAETARLSFIAKDPMTLDKDKAESILKLIDALEDSDDVQYVYGNFDIPDDVIAQLSED